MGLQTAVGAISSILGFDLLKWTIDVARGKATLADNPLVQDIIDIVRSYKKVFLDGDATAWDYIYVGLSLAPVVGHAAKGIWRGFSRGRAAFKRAAPTMKNASVSLFRRLCFVAGTLVLMGDDSLKPIDEIAIGEQVRCDYDPEANNGMETCVVTRTLKRTAGQVLDLVLETGATSTTIVTTPNHPFYVPGKGTYSPAIELARGTRLADSARTSPRVAKQVLRTWDDSVYNIEVEGAHNYFASAAAGGPQLLVHNGRCEWPGWTFFTSRRSAKRAAFRKAGIGRHGEYEEVFDRGRKGWRNRDNDMVVWDDSGGHVFWDADSKSRMFEPPHFQVEKYTPGKGPSMEKFSW